MVITCRASYSSGMQNYLFDELAKAISRERALKVLGASVLAVFIPGVAEARHKRQRHKKHHHCKSRGQTCFKSEQCCGFPRNTCHCIGPGGGFCASRKPKGCPKKPPPGIRVPPGVYVPRRWSGVGLCAARRRTLHVLTGFVFVLPRGAPPVPAAMTVIYA